MKTTLETRGETGELAAPSAREVAERLEALGLEVLDLSDVAALRTLVDRLADELERRQTAEQELQRQRTLAINSDRLRSLGEMAASMAHELNQPLVGVRGLAEHLQIGLKRGWEISQDKILDNLSLIIGQADRMSALLNHLRTFAREADRLEPRTVDVGEVIHSALDLVRTHLRLRGIVVEVDVADGLPPIRVNPFALEEVLLNLIFNARDAIVDRAKEESPPGQHTLSIRAYALPSPSGQPEVTLQVTDNGVGMTREVLAEAFEPFFTTKGPDRGAGLGLATSRTIISSFSGRIELRSTPNVGTSVRIVLPAAPAAEVEP